ncbi:MAG: hypothetical protein AB7G44_01095 [Bacteroidia bacterium]
MAVYKIRCKRSYHYLIYDAINDFAVGVADGVYGHPATFMSPTITEVDFRALITDFVNKKGSYESGNVPRTVFITAKDNLMAGLDTIADYVDGVAQGNENTVTLGGYEATKATSSKVNPPVQPTGVVLKRGINGELLAECTRMNKVVFYGAILIADNPLPPNIGINAAGQVVVTNTNTVPTPPSPTPGPTPGSMYYVLDFNKARKKKFTDLTKGRMYYVYFYAANAGGVSPLSEGTGLDPL